MSLSLYQHVEVAIGPDRFGFSRFGVAEIVSWSVVCDSCGGLGDPEDVLWTRDVDTCAPVLLSCVLPEGWSVRGASHLCDCCGGA